MPGTQSEAILGESSMRSGHQYSSTVISRPHPHPLGGKGLWRCFLELITRFLITVLAELAHLAAHGANEKAMVVTREQFSFLSFSLGWGGGYLLGKLFLILIDMLAGLKGSLG